LKNKKKKRKEKIKEEEGENINDDFLMASGDDDSKGCEGLRL